MTRELLTNDWGWGKKQRAVLVVNKRNVTRKFEPCTRTIMSSLHVGQDVANKRERKQTAAHIVAKSYLLYTAVKMYRYGCLININLSGKKEKFFANKLDRE